MNATAVLQFIGEILLPVAVCAALLFLRKSSAGQRIPGKAWQVLVGAIFGVIAIIGTETGVPTEGAVMNVRDASPLIAGLMFGGPAGIIAGIIGGVERWIAVAWGMGAFTQVACSVATIFAGIYAALLRKYFFERHIPNLSFAFATGVVAEVLHMMLVFVTHPENTAHALEVTQACALPMIFGVGIAVMLSSLVTHKIQGVPVITPSTNRNVARILHTRMLAAVVAAFLVTIGFTAALQTNLSQAETSELLQLNIEDVERDIIKASDENLLDITQLAADNLHSVKESNSAECVRIADELDVAEINVIDEHGIIVASTEPNFIGFDMASGEQSSAFLVLLQNDQQQLVQSYQPISYDASTSRKYAGVAIEGGFVQVGYDAQNFLDDLSTQVESSVKNRHVGKTGVLVVIDEEGNVISTQNDVADQSAENLVADTSKVDSGRVFTTMFSDEPCYAEYHEVEGYRIIALLPTEEADSSRNASVLIMAFMEVLVFAALFLVIYAVIKKVFVRGIRKMNRQLGQITAGELNTTLDVRTCLELSSLSDDINQTVGVLKESLAVVKADLDSAACVQANTLPDITSALTARPEFELYATMEPAKEVGGDFYDFFLVDEDHLALIVADVSGKGVAAALFMMRSKTIIKMETLSGISPAAVLYRASADLSENNDDDMFTTAWIGILEFSSGKLVFADAGHEKLAICQNGQWDIPEKPNRAVALASFDEESYEQLPEKYRYRDHTITLQPGDALFQYTDGVTEATDAEDNLFGEERLLNALRESGTTDPNELLPKVRSCIGKFVKDAPQFDDITMLGIQYNGKKGI